MIRTAATVLVEEVGKGSSERVAVWITILAGALLSGPAWTQEPTAPPGRVIPEQVVTAVSCGECHASEQVVWEKTTHATGFKTMHRKESAAAIAERLDIKLIKRDSMCLDCHYTPTPQRGELRAESGVSCESCHGSGEGWIDIHNDYGKGKDHDTETAEHRQMRIEASRAAGMRRPSDLYPVLASCFACHTVPNEELVNVGKHSLGSSGFEVVARVDQIRHNFLDSFITGDGAVNAELSEAHKRRMYVVGRALDLEYSLRGLAQATESGVFFKAMQRRLRSAIQEVRAVAQVGDLTGAEDMVSVAREVDAKLGRKDALLAAADRVGELNRAFLAEHDESAESSARLASLDPLIAGETVELEPEPFEVPARGAVVTADGGIVDGATPAVAAGGAQSPGSQPAGSRVEVVPGIDAEGEKRSHLRPRSQFDTLPASACQKCHGEQNAWWFDDPHYAAVEPFLDRAAAPSKIARLYGLSPSVMARGDSLCMDCHGTVATARASREAQDGVSCQSCHGPGASYLEPHQEGEKELGRQRPGFQKALGLGMKDLEDLETRMKNCASCHYVTDPRLISSGHPTGVDFDVARGMGEIKHWEGVVESADALRAAYSRVISARGPVPSVRKARLPQRIVVGADGQATVAAPEETGGAPRRPKVRAPRPVDRRASVHGRASSTSTEPVELDLPELPEVPAETPIEEVLRLIKERVELLYERLGTARVHGGRQGDGS